MSDAKNLKRLGVAGGIAAALGAFAHGTSDCARVGARAPATAGDDIARIAPVGAGDDIARIAPVVERRSSALPAADTLSTPNTGRAFGEDLARRTLDAVDLLLDIGAGADHVEHWGPIGAPTYIALHHMSSRVDFGNELGAASVGPPVFVIGQASETAADAISILNSAVAVGEIQSECLSHGVSCVVLICGPDTGSSGSCVARTNTVTRAAVAKATRRLDRVLRELLHERAARRWDKLRIYRLADTPDGPRIVRSTISRSWE